MTSSPWSHDPRSATPESLFAAWHDARDESARDELIRRYLPLARKLAARYARTGEPYEDLIQVASVGLINAVERFDPNHGAAFASFAIPTILGELKRHFRDSTSTVQIDRRSQAQARAVVAAQRELSAAGRSPTVAELAAFMDWDVETVLDGLQASLAFSAVSLDAPSSSAGSEDSLPASLGELVGAPDERLERVDDRASLTAAAQHLPKLERRILYLRFGQDLSQREIADQVGISQMHVSRLLARSLKRLREHFGDRSAAA